MAENMTLQEAYAAMFAFLEDLYRQTESNDLGALLGGMSLLEDGVTADPAYWQDWQAAVCKVKDGKVNLGLQLRKNQK